MQGRLLQLAKSQSLHLDKRQGLWPAKKPEDIRQHALSAASMLRYTHWYIKVSETKENSSCTISRWDLLWKCWDCVYGGTEETKAISRSHPPHTHTTTTTWKRMWRRQSFALVETAVKHVEAEVKFAKILIQAFYPFSSKE